MYFGRGSKNKDCKGLFFSCAVKDVYGRFLGLVVLVTTFYGKRESKFVEEAEKFCCV